MRKSPVSPVVPLIIDLLERAPAASPFVPVACQSGPMDPPRSRDTNSVISVVQGFHEEVRPTQTPAGRWLSSSGCLRIALVACPPNLRRLGPCDNISDLRTSAKLGTPEAFSHLREWCHSEHRPLDSTLRDANCVFILLSCSLGL
ncbi:unnamed protein product [Heligmosomoides polygyrus]|uniref:Secreted protein n=1 Tax=Heligmosomoides polygyrus TaxID=6339 RepID=A0A183GNH2_HELPZ|nr:unnamed protein product [Heligmosomoides polygyrus]